MFPRHLLQWFDPAEAELEQELFELQPRDLPGGNMPPAEKPRRTYKRRCPETGVEFETTGKDRQFATDKAKADFHNRSSKIGRKLIPLAMAWRMGRNAKGNSPAARALRASAAKAFAQMCRQLDEAIAEDRAEGRVGKLDYVRQRDAIAGDLSSVERAGYQAKIVAAQAVVRERLGAAALDLTVRQLDELAAAEVSRQARADKAGLLAKMGIKG
jgi:hypothetical protein